MSSSDKGADINTKSVRTGSMRAGSGAVGSVIEVNNQGHQGITKKPTEARAERIVDKWLGKVNSKFIPRSVVMSGDRGKIYTVNGVVVTKEEYDKAGERTDDA